ncbi:MAG: hypothetical protein ACR2QQ_05635 [Gammaproteobacteria bacterium]
MRGACRHRWGLDRFGIVIIVRTFDPNEDKDVTTQYVDEDCTGRTFEAWETPYIGTGPNNRFWPEEVLSQQLVFRSAHIAGGKKGLVIV